MPEKKFLYNYDDIIKAIVLHFGSVDNFAKKIKTSRENIYQKAKRQTAKFIGSLRDEGIELDHLNNNNILNSSFISRENQSIPKNNEDINTILLNNIINQLSDFGNRIRKIEEFIERIKEHSGKPVPGKKKL